MKGVVLNNKSHPTRLSPSECEILTARADVQETVYLCEAVGFCLFGQITTLSLVEAMRKEKEKR